MASNNPYEALDQEITSIFEVYLTLKIRRNDLVLVVRLPPEILSTIFIAYACMLSPPVDEWQTVRVPYPYSWIAITHICKRWRDVALNTVGLWTTIWLSWVNMEAVEAILFRSKQAPLVINIQERTHPRCGEALRILALQVGRTRKLGFEMPSMRYEYIKFKDFPPVLRSLNLSSVYIRAKLPWFVTQESAPNLTELKLNNFIVQWSPHIFSPSLRYLEILHSRNTVAGEDENRVLLSRVIATVSNLHLLEKLTLLDVFLPVSDVSALPRVTDPTLMPYMTRLHLRGPVLAIFRFLDFFALPVCTDIDLASAEPCDAERAPTLASSLISAVTSGAKWENATRVIGQLSLSFDELIIVTRKVLHRDVIPIRFPDDTEMHTIRFSAYGLGRLGRLAPPVWALAAHLPLHDVSMLTLSHAICVDMALWETIPDSWLTMRSAMQNVTTVKLSGSTPVEIPLLNFLILGDIASDDLIAESLEASPEQEFFPKLTSLFVSSGFFEKSRSPGNFKVDPSEFVQEIRWLVEYCAMQPGRANIEEIMVLDSLELDPSDVSALEKFVPVAWDGKRRSRLSA